MNMEQSSAHLSLLQFDLATLLDSLKQRRQAYADLLNKLSPSGSEAEIKNKYVELFTTLDDLLLEHEQPKDEMLIQFDAAVSPLGPLLTAIEQTLIVRSVKSQHDRQTLHDFGQLPFIQRLHSWLEGQPSLTRHGLDAVLSLLEQLPEERRSGAPTLKPPVGLKGSSPASTSTQSTRRGYARSIHSPDAVATINAHFTANPLLDRKDFAKAADITERGLRNVLQTERADRKTWKGIANAMKIPFDTLIPPPTHS
jgi:hypothetical protein